MNVKNRCQAIERETKKMEFCKNLSKAFIPDKLENGDSPKLLLTRIVE